MSTTSTADTSPAASGTDEMEVRWQRERWKAAFEAGDVDRMMSFYAPEIVAFDIMPPLRFAGEGEWRDNWVSFFAMFDGHPTLELRDQVVLCAGDLAVVRTLTRLMGTTRGQPMDAWARETSCLRRVDGTWLIVHDHVSIPVEFATGQARMDLTP